MHIPFIENAKSSWLLPRPPIKRNHESAEIKKNKKSYIIIQIKDHLLTHSGSLEPLDIVIWNYINFDNNLDTQLFLRYTWRRVVD